jgi:hypothetical protein
MNLKPDRWAIISRWQSQPLIRKAIGEQIEI